MTKDTTRNNPGAVSFAFNATQIAVDEANQRPWRRAALMARAEDEFRRLHALKPAWKLS